MTKLTPRTPSRIGWLLPDVMNAVAINGTRSAETRRSKDRQQEILLLTNKPPRKRIGQGSTEKTHEVRQTKSKTVHGADFDD